MNPWLFIIIPFLLIIVAMHVCKWAEAYDKYKTFSDPTELVLMAICTAFSISIGYGIYKLAF